MKQQSKTDRDLEQLTALWKSVTPEARRADQGEARKWLDDLDDKWSTFRERLKEPQAAKLTVVDGGAANGEGSTEPSDKPIELGRVNDHFETSRWSK